MGFPSQVVVTKTVKHDWCENAFMPDWLKTLLPLTAPALIAGLAAVARTTSVTARRLRAELQVDVTIASSLSGKARTMLDEDIQNKAAMMSVLERFPVFMPSDFITMVATSISLLAWSVTVIPLLIVRNNSEEVSMLTLVLFSALCLALTAVCLSFWLSSHKYYLRRAAVRESFVDFSVERERHLGPLGFIAISIVGGWTVPIYFVSTIIGSVPGGNLEYILINGAGILLSFVGGAYLYPWSVSYYRAQVARPVNDPR